MWTWERLISFYTALTNSPSYTWEYRRRYVEEMLVLLPQLEALAEKKGLQPRLFMYVIELVAGDQDMAVRPIREDSGLYGLQKVSVTTEEDLLFRVIELDDLIATLDALI